MNANDIFANSEDNSFMNAIAHRAPNSSTHTINGFLGFNLGHPTILTVMSLTDFYRYSKVANDRQNMPASEIAQRNLDLNHAKKLGIYILKSLVQSVVDDAQKKGETIPEEYIKVSKDLGTQPYASLQPVVVNIRTQDNKIPKFVSSKPFQNNKGFEFELNQSHTFWVIDGQHRRKGIELLFEELESIIQNGIYPSKGLYIPSFIEDKKEPITENVMSLYKKIYTESVNNATIAVEVHLGLSVEQERQLFHDLNRLGKKMDTNLALNYDSSNPINNFVSEYLEGELKLHISDSEIKNWEDDKGDLPRKDIASINARLFLNKTNINSATKGDVDSVADVAKRFWTAVCNIPHMGEYRAKCKTVAAQPVVLKALAKLAYDYAISKRKPENGEELFEVLINGINQTGEKKIDFSHENPMWRYYEMTDEEREKSGLHGLKEYLPVDNDGANRDIGSYQPPYFRFGSKHNDIFPIIASMIRWELGLPNNR